MSAVCYRFFDINEQEINKFDHLISNQSRSMRIDDLPRYHAPIDLHGHMRIADVIQETL